MIRCVKYDFAMRSRCDPFKEKYYLRNQIAFQTDDDMYGEITVWGNVYFERGTKTCFVI